MINHLVFNLFLSLSLSVPKERLGSEQTSPQYTPFIPPGMFVTTLNTSAFIEGGGGSGAVGSGRRGGNPGMPDSYGNVEHNVTEKDVSSGYGSQLEAHSEDTTVSLIVHTTKILCYAWLFTSLRHSLPIGTSVIFNGEHGQFYRLYGFI